MMVKISCCCFLFLSFVSTTIVCAQDLESSSKKDQYLLSIMKGIDDNVKVYHRLYDEASEVSLDSLSIVKERIKYLLNEVDSLDSKQLYASRLSDEEVVTGNNHVLQIIETIRNSGQLLLSANQKLSNEVLAITQPAFLKIKVKEIIDNHKSIMIGVQMVKDLKSDRDDIHMLFKKPIEIGGISEYYKQDSEIIQMLMGNKPSVGKKEKTDVVVKGYSPFSNVYKEFAFIADSTKKNETEQKDTANIPEVIKEPIIPEVVNETDTASDTLVKQEIDIKLDSLYQRALKDSLFPHEMISRYDKESLEKYWSIYQEQREESLKRKKPFELSEAPISSDKLNETQKTTIIEDDKSEITLVTSHKQSLTVPQSKPSIILNTTPTQVEESEVVYFVQIAAGKTPVSHQILSSLYSGDDSISIRHEDGWLKYQVGGTPDYHKAELLKNQVNVPRAFVVAYQKDNKQLLWKTKSWLQYSQKRSGLDFVVQVSANQKQMSVSQKKKMEEKLGGEIREVVEDGWYKYQLVIGSSYPDAVKKWKEIGIKVSFMVSYHNNKKIAMSEAVRIYKDYKRR